MFITDKNVKLTEPQQNMIRRGLELLTERNTFVGHCQKSDNLKAEVEDEEYWHPAHIRELSEVFGGDRPKHPRALPSQEEE